MIVKSNNHIHVNPNWNPILGKYQQQFRKNKTIDVISTLGDLGKAVYGDVFFQRVFQFCVLD